MESRKRSPFLLVLLAVVGIAIALGGIGFCTLFLREVLKHEPVKAPEAADGRIEDGVELLATGGQPSALAVDGDFVYWSDAKTGSLFRQPKDGAGLVALATVTGWRESRIALDDENEYWFVGDWEREGGERAGIYRLPKRGGEPVRITTIPSVNCLAADPGSASTGELFWAYDNTPALVRDCPPGMPINSPRCQLKYRDQNFVSAPPKAMLPHALKTATDVKVESAGYLQCVATDTSGIYFTAKQEPGSLAAFSKRKRLHELYAMPRQGGEPRRLREADCTALALDANDVYCADKNLGIFRSPKAGGEAAALWTPPEGRDMDVVHIALDSTHVYFVGHMGGGSALYRVAKRGGVLETLRVEIGTFIKDVALDESYVYWATEGGPYSDKGRVARRKK